MTRFVEARKQSEANGLVPDSASECYGTAQNTQCGKRRLMDVAAVLEASSNKSSKRKWLLASLSSLLIVGAVAQEIQQHITDPWHAYISRPSRHLRLELAAPYDT